MEGKETKDNFTDIRRKMVKTDLAGRGIADHGVLEVMGQLPRQDFISQTYQSQAYADGPLPIGMGQTISQPYIVALMTEHLKLNKNCSVLEIGTGCGYQTAILCKLAKKVYTIERHHQLSELAQATLTNMDIKNVEFYIGDGTKGWPEKIDFDRIIITAAAPSVPQPLLDQLVVGGILVGPIGSGGVQKLIVCKKQAVGTTEKSVCDVRFVKLIGQYGFAE